MWRTTDCGLLRGASLSASNRWHRTDPRGWFRLAAGKSNDLWIYRVGPEPFAYLCRTVWSYGNPPIPCNTYWRPIDRAHARLDDPRAIDS